jgi:hypothetical protein
MMSNFFLLLNIQLQLSPKILLNWLADLFWRYVPMKLRADFHVYDSTSQKIDRLCGTVVRVPGSRSRDTRFDSRRYQIFWEVVGLERSLLSLVKITKKLLEWKSSASRSRKSRLTAVGIRYADHATPSNRKKFAPTSPTCGGRLVGIVHLRTKATEFG